METRRYTQAAGNPRRKAGKDQDYRRRAPSWLMRVSLLVLVAVGFVAAFTAQASAATVATDHTDYAASEVALITGSGWTPGEVVALEFAQAPQLHAADVLYTLADFVIADASGNIHSGDAVPGHNVAQVFTLTATGQTSNLTATATFTNSLNPAAVTSPTVTTLVQTDKGDYMPGETVIITGSGWTSGETVALEIVEAPQVHPAETLHAIADSAGTIDAGYVVDDHDLGRTFTLTATGQTSHLTAQMTFTDAPPSTCNSNADCNNGCRVCNTTTHACTTTSVGAGTSCGDPDNTACNAPDTCNAGGVCVDRKKAAAVVCQPGTGTCDPDHTCDGTSNTCNTHFAAALTACGDADSTACNAPDSCDGTGTCVDRKKAVGFVCQAAGPDATCDPAHTCDGTSNTCNAHFAAALTACGDPTNTTCNAADTCDGAGACQANLAAAGTPCEDGIACTQNDTCYAGVCIPGATCGQACSSLLTPTASRSSSWAAPSR